MTNQTIPPCPACEKAPTSHSDCVIGNDTCKYCAGVHNDWGRHINHIWFVCINELGIGTVEQLRELVGIACDACDERTVRATNRAENLVPLLRRRAVKGEK